MFFLFEHAKSYTLFAIFILSRNIILVVVKLSNLSIRSCLFKDEEFKLVCARAEFVTTLS